MRLWQIVSLLMLFWITLVAGTVLYSFITTGKQ